MLFRHKLFLLFSYLFLALSLTACGGGSSKSDSDTTEQYLTGTAAKGAPIAGTVTTIDAGGVTATTTIAADGSFQVQVTGLTGPFMLKAEPSNGSDPVLYSFAAGLGDVANITPLTSLALFMANGNADPASLFDTWASAASNLTTSIQAQQAIVNANLEAAGLLSGNGLSNTFNFFTQVFSTNGQGLDAVLDSLTVDLSSGISVNVSGNGGFSFNESISTTGFTIGGGSSNSATLPAYVAGQIVDMEFCCSTAGAPYVNGEIVKFTFSSSGSLMLTDQYTLVAATFTNNSNSNAELYVWDDGTYSYELSVLNQAIHEVNVSLSADSTFLGQFTPTSGGNSGIDLSLVIALTGTYNVDTINFGTHSRMTITINAQGGVDFDTGMNFPAASAVSIYDQTGCCNRIDVEYGEINGISPNASLRFYLDGSGALQQIVLQSEPNITTVTDLVVSTSNGGAGSSTPFTIDFTLPADVTACDPSQLTEFTGSTLLGSLNASVFGWNGDTDEPGAFFEVMQDNPSSGQHTIRFVCANLSHNWEATGSSAELGISIDSNGNSVTFSNTELTPRFNGFLDSNFQVVPASSLILNGTLQE